MIICEWPTFNLNTLSLWIVFSNEFTGLKANLPWLRAVQSFNSSHFCHTFLCVWDYSLKRRLDFNFTEVKMQIHSFYLEQLNQLNVETPSSVDNVSSEKFKSPFVTLITHWNKKKMLQTIDIKSYTVVDFE